MECSPRSGTRGQHFLCLRASRTFRSKSAVANDDYAAVEIDRTGEFIDYRNMSFGLFTLACARQVVINAPVVLSVYYWNEQGFSLKIFALQRNRPLHAT